ncbi:hypothetical protein WA026_004165 [Henosepilachna vigintioctopunctata]|uniref:TROVE domain-containing protein n=1 Tax=Henosepilachna vigintioctopunctata TaxID=420089 RepID=A0AAW1U6P6_9CUCU
MSASKKKAMKLSLEKLDRFIFLTHVEGRYISGNPEKYILKDVSEHLEFLKTLLLNLRGTIIFLQHLKSLSPIAPRRVTLFYILAYALLHSVGPEDHSMRNIILKTFLDICETDEELFKFISIYTKMTPHKNKVTSALGKAVSKYLKTKSSKQYIIAVGKAKGYHGWEYKDVIKLSHYKGETREKLIISTYVVRGLEHLKDLEAKEAKEIYDSLEKYERLRKTDDEDEASVLITELHANFSQVNSKFIKSQKVWSAIIPELSIQEVLRLLPKLDKNGLLEANSKVHTAVIKAITSKRNVELNELLPIDVFISMKDFEKGGKPLDPKLEQYLKSKSESSDVKEKIEKLRSKPKCSIVTSSLEECFKLSYQNLFNIFRPKKGKIMALALDVTQDTDLTCFKNKNITCLEAQLFLALYYAKMEKNVNVTLYQNSEVKEFILDENVPFDENLQKLKDNKSDKVVLPSVFEWAIKKEKKVDVFICFINSVRSLCAPSKEDKTSTWNSLKNEFHNYRKHISSNSTKLVLMCLGSHKLPGFEDIKGGLTIHGFCPEIPSVIDCFREEFYK